MLCHPEFDRRKGSFEYLMGKGKNSKRPFDKLRVTDRGGAGRRRAYDSLRNSGRTSRAAVVSMSRLCHPSTGSGSQTEEAVWHRTPSVRALSRGWQWHEGFGVFCKFALV